MKKTNYDKIGEDIEDLAEHIKLDDISHDIVWVFFEDCGDTEDYIGEILDILDINNITSKFNSEVTNIRYTDNGILVTFSACLDEERDLFAPDPDDEWDREDKLTHERRDGDIGR